MKAEKPAKPEKPEKITITTAVFAVVDDAVRHASDGFKNTITARQAFYSVRSLIKDRFPTVEELKDSYFTQDLLPRYRRENNTDHWPVINYDARGSASEPHDGRKNIQLSTVGVCNLIRSEPNTEKISAVLFIEKEQFGEIIGPVQNEFDLFLIEAKGQGTIAEKQALKWAADAGLPVFIFSDCDIAGFQISEAIRNGTERFPYPIPSVKRIGLDLEDAHALNLLPEPYTPEQKHRKWLEGSNLDQGLKDFIRHKRFELNHLSTNQMRDLLRRKLTGAKVPKAMPTPGSLMSKLRESAWGSIAERLTSDLEERIRIMRQELDDEIADRVRAFAQAVVDATDPDMLHAETKKTLTSKHYRGGPWEAAFVYTVCDLSIISEPLEAELRKDHQ
ncbi:MAG: hypothetical protein NTW21_19410 [Verrucomicrobia bacterium]|nr:hypothetical protein [Verrucomicrobiota bacterium]